MRCPCIPPPPQKKRFQKVFLPLYLLRLDTFSPTLCCSLIVHFLVSVSAGIQGFLLSSKLMNVHDLPSLTSLCSKFHLYLQDPSKLLEIEGLECELDALRLESKLKLYLRGAVEVKL